MCAWRSRIKPFSSLSQPTAAKLTSALIPLSDETTHPLPATEAGEASEDSRLARLPHKLVARYLLVGVRVLQLLKRREGTVEGSTC